MYVCMLMRFLKQKLKTNSSCIEQFLGLSDTHRDCVYIRYFYYLFSRKLPMFDLLDKNWEFPFKTNNKLSGVNMSYMSIEEAPKISLVWTICMQKMMKYLISFPNEHKQLGILSFQMVGAKKSKTIIYCKCFFHSGKKGKCMPCENKQ